MNTKSRNRRRMALRLSLAGLAVVGVGAAVTSAVWTDDVFFTATATSSSFDLQGRALPTDDWSDVGIPGDSDVTPIDISTDLLAALAPGEIYTVPFQLCNIGSASGTITDVSDVTIAGALAADAGLSAVVSDPIVSVALPSDPGCLTPIGGNLRITTTTAFNTQDAEGVFTFSVTGESD